MVKQLLTARRFGPLFLTQFLAALNDNFLKQSLVLLCLFKIGGPTGAMLGTIAGAVLIAPFFLLSAFAGELADKYDKAMLARRMKFAEIFGAAFAAAGFLLQSVPLLMIALGLYGAIAAKRHVTSSEIEDRMMTELRRIPDARIHFQRQSASGGNADMTLFLTGDGPVLLDHTAGQVLNEMRTLHTLRDPRINGDPQQPEIVIRPRLDLAAALGVRVAEVAAAVEKRRPRLGR